MGRNGHIGQIKRVTFTAERDRTGAAELRPPLRRFPLQRAKEPVVVPWVVVDEQQSLNAAATAEDQRIRDARVTPAAVRGVLVLGVLAVMDEERRTAGERVSGDPGRRGGGEVLAESRLVVGQVAEAGPVLTKPVAQRRSPVGDERRPQLDRADSPRLRGDIPEGHVGGKLADLDRGERVGDVAGETLAQRAPCGRRAPDGDLDLGIEEGVKNIRP